MKITNIIFIINVSFIMFITKIIAVILIIFVMLLTKIIDNEDYVSYKNNVSDEDN